MTMANHPDPKSMAGALLILMLAALLLASFVAAGVVSLIGWLV